MKNLLIILLLSFSLFSCEKEDTKVANTPDQPIIGKWGPWNRHIRYLEPQGNDPINGIQSWQESIIEFKTDNTIIHTVGGNFNASGNFSLSGNKIQLSLSNGVFINGGIPINMLTPNPYTGYIISINSKEIVFRDTISLPNGKLAISTYSANRQ